MIVELVPATPERGATLVEYALLVSLVVVATLLAIDTLSASSGSYLSSTGDQIGEPRDRFTDIDDDLVDPPLWLP